MPADDREQADPEPAHVQAERAAGGRAVAHRDEHPADDAAAQQQEQQAITTKKTAITKT